MGVKQTWTRGGSRCFLIVVDLQGFPPTESSSVTANKLLDWCHLFIGSFNLEAPHCAIH